MYKEIQTRPEIPASISLYMTVAAERACLRITLGSGERAPCSSILQSINAVDVRHSHRFFRSAGFGSGLYR